MKEMTSLDPHLVAVLLATGVAGVLMTMSGVQKSLLDWRRRRICPGCGRPLAHGRCGCCS
jgi:hypothetical protein